MQGVQCTQAQRCGGPKICPTLFLKSFFGEEGALLEYLHAGPLQPCYATDYTRKMLSPCAVMHDKYEILPQKGHRDYTIITTNRSLNW